MPKICTLIKEWRISELWATCYSFLHSDISDGSFIPRQIEEIYFPNLKVLSIIHNKIESIEGFHRTQLPVLERAYLGKNSLDEGYNHICFAADFKKENWFKLKTLAISSNIIPSGIDIFRMRSSDLERLSLEYSPED